MIDCGPFFLVSPTGREHSPIRQQACLQRFGCASASTINPLHVRLTRGSQHFRRLGRQRKKATVMIDCGLFFKTEMSERSAVATKKQQHDAYLAEFPCVIPFVYSLAYLPPSLAALFSTTPTGAPTVGGCCHAKVHVLNQCVPRRQRHRQHARADRQWYLVCWLRLVLSLV